MKFWGEILNLIIILDSPYNIQYVLQIHINNILLIKKIIIKKPQTQEGMRGGTAVCSSPRGTNWHQLHGQIRRGHVAEQTHVPCSWRCSKACPFLLEKARLVLSFFNLEIRGLVFIRFGKFYGFSLRFASILTRVFVRVDYLCLNLFKFIKYSIYMRSCDVVVI